MSLFAMAWRNLWRNRRRTLVTVGAMSLALCVTILYSGLVQGYLRNMERNILDLELGDLQVHAAGYRDKPSLYTRIPHPEQVVAALEKAGLTASSRLFAAGMAAAGENSAGAIFRGVDLRRDPRVSSVHRHVAKGRWLHPDHPDQVVIGRRLAHTLGVEPGAELVVLSQGADGSMANELYRVRGVLRPISDGVDRGGIFLSQGAFRRLLVLPEGAHQIAVRKPETMPLARARALAAGALGSEEGLELKTWKELVPTLASMLEAAQGAMYTMFFIVYLAIAIVILNAMLMAVFERIREFGVLKAIGMGPGTVLRLVLLEAGLQTGLAVAIGGGLSLPGIWYLSRHGLNLSSMAGTSIYGIAWDPVWKVVVRPEIFVGPVVMLVAVVFVAVLYPAGKAALIRPIAAIQHR